MKEGWGRWEEGARVVVGGFPLFSETIGSVDPFQSSRVLNFSIYSRDEIVVLDLRLEGGITVESSVPMTSSPPKVLGSSPLLAHAALLAVTAYTYYFGINPSINVILQGTEPLPST